jgi:hypothetical protein
MMRFFVGLFCLLLTVACGSDGVQPTAESVSAQDMTARALTTAIAASAEPPFDASLLLAELETAVSLWHSQAIERYQITVRHRQATWNTQIFTITVENGTVVDNKHSCFPEQDCILQEVDPDTLTIEALFETAAAVIGFSDPETEITFNPSYGYPNALIYEEASWTLDSFKPLEDE